MRCPVCSQVASFAKVEEAGEYELLQCLVCAVIFAKPMTNPGAAWYERSELYVLGKHLTRTLSWQHRQFLDRPPLGKRLLDVGCGTGLLLHEAKARGYDPWGLDFDREDIAIARERHGLENLYALSIENFTREFAGQKFDVITFFEVLEHMESPPRFIELVRGLLKPGGKIALSVPNRDRLLDTMGDGDYPPNHLTRWNSAVLAAFLDREGFDPVDLVIKEFAWDEVAGFLKAKVKLGIAKRMAVRALDRNDMASYGRATALMRTKDVVTKAIAAPIAAVLKPFHPQGSGLFCIGRLR